tara:strand:+ start:3846 stop:4085 length:240 start_codon:yes stop_codon:yes gene_type:complete
MSPNNSVSPSDHNKKSVTDSSIPSAKPQNDTSGTKKESIPLREHPNKFIRFFARAGFTVWIIVMVVGLSIAFVVSVFLL